MAEKKRRIRNSEKGMLICEKALGSKRGIRLRVSSRKLARHFQHQVHIARRFELDTLERDYESSDPRRYEARYKSISTSIEDRGTAWYLIVTHTTDIEFGEMLSTSEEI